MVALLPWPGIPTTASKRALFNFSILAPVRTSDLNEPGEDLFVSLQTMLCGQCTSIVIPSITIRRYAVFTLVVQRQYASRWDTCRPTYKAVSGN